MRFWYRRRLKTSHLCILYLSVDLNACYSDVFPWIEYGKMGILLQFFKGIKIQEILSSYRQHFSGHYQRLCLLNYIFLYGTWRRKKFQTWRCRAVPAWSPPRSGWWPMLSRPFCECSGGSCIFALCPCLQHQTLGKPQNKSLFNASVIMALHIKKELFCCFS